MVSAHNHPGDVGGDEADESDRPDEAYDAGGDEGRQHHAITFFCTSFSTDKLSWPYYLVLYILLLPWFVLTFPRVDIRKAHILLDLNLSPAIQRILDESPVDLCHW